MRRAIHRAVLGALLACGTTAAHAGTLSVGKWTVEESCRSYVTEWEREVAVETASSRSAGAAVATPYGAAGMRRSSSQSSSAYLREWGTVLNEVCAQNFPRIRSTLASALASNGTVDPGDGAFTIDGFVTDIGHATTTFDSASAAETNDDILVSISYQVRNARGNVVYGGALTKRFNVAHLAQGGGTNLRSAQSGRTVFSQLQQEVGFAVARQILFHFLPLRVAAKDGQAVAFNYGPPLIPMGAAIMVSGERSLRPRRLIVTGALPGRAVAESPAMIGLGDITIGSTAFFAEEEDGYSDQSLLPSVPLP